jgi:short-subunit dehydrogenase
MGIDLVLVDRDPAALAITAGALERQVAVLPVTLDLARPDVADALVAAVGARDVGLLVYNAAIGTVSRFLDITAAHATAMLDVNCRAPMLLVRALAPAMVGRGRGGIVLMSSMSGNFGSEQLAVYAASKAFDLVFADALWAELRGAGVDVLAVQPGSTRTPGWQSSQPEALRGPGPHVAEPEDVVPGEMNRQGAAMLASLPRRQAVEMMSSITRDLLPNR